MPWDPVSRSISFSGLLLTRKSLAYLEIYMTLATLFSRFVLELESPLPRPELEWTDQFVIVFDHPVKVRVLGDLWTSEKGSDPSC